MCYLLSLVSSVMVTTVVSGVPIVTVGFIGPGLRLTEKVWSPSTFISWIIVTVMHPGINGPNGKLASGFVVLKSVPSNAAALFDIMGGPTRNDKYGHESMQANTS